MLKYALLVMGWLAMVVAALAQTQTPNIGLVIPPAGSQMLFNGQPAGYPCIEINQTVANQVGGLKFTGVRCSGSANTPTVKNDITGYQTGSTKFLTADYTYPGISTISEPMVIDGPLSVPLITSTVLYSAAGTALPACAAANKGQTTTVSDATSPTYLANYTSGGTVASPVMCNGTNWVTY